MVVAAFQKTSLLFIYYNQSFCLSVLLDYWCLLCHYKLFLAGTPWTVCHCIKKQTHTPMDLHIFGCTLVHVGPPYLRFVCSTKVIRLRVRATICKDTQCDCCSLCSTDRMQWRRKGARCLISSTKLLGSTWIVGNEGISLEKCRL